MTLFFRASNLQNKSAYFFLDNNHGGLVQRILWHKRRPKSSKLKYNYIFLENILGICSFLYQNYGSWLKLAFEFVQKFLARGQANGRACVDFGCTHPIDGLFGSLPIYLLGFLSKYECGVSVLIISLYHFLFFLSYHFPFSITRFRSLWNVKFIIWLIF
jgi:hypothetical protein